MKISKIVLGTLLIGGLSMSSCKKGCTDGDATNYEEKAKKDDGTCKYLPIISLNGQASVTVGVGSTYTEDGATAANPDGSSVDVTIDNTSVNTNQTGVYTVTYTAENANGTATATRTVNVEVNQATLVSDWTLDSCPDCGTTSFPLADNTGEAGAGANDLNFTGFFTLVGGTATATVSGSTITFPQQSIAITGGTIDFSGTGTINSAGNEMVIDFAYDNTVPLIGGSGTATATYVK